MRKYFAKSCLAADSTFGDTFPSSNHSSLHPKCRYHNSVGRWTCENSQRRIQPGSLFATFSWSPDDIISRFVSAVGKSGETSIILESSLVAKSKTMRSEAHVRLCDLGGSAGAPPHNGYHSVLHGLQSQSQFYQAHSSS